jgi:ssDNA-binding Zn-finger/Zn-ribbon topoisomerase 1
MEPTRDKHATLVDLLDRVLDKGLVINADIIISVAGIPLLGVNLRAALAGMETMLKYGIMNDWDELTREYARREWKKKEPHLRQGEKIVLRTFGSHRLSKGIYNSWRTGYFYITNKRILLFREEPTEVLFETPFERIRGLAIQGKELYILLKEPRETAILHAKSVSELKGAIENEVRRIGLNLEDVETCPKCGNLEAVTRLLEGCPQCGWTSSLKPQITIPVLQD